MGPEDQHEQPFDQESYEEWLNRPPQRMETFSDWWLRDGRMFDPDTSDVPWFDKRKDLAEKAFNAALAQSRNYTCDDSVLPTEVTFANGRTVTMVKQDDGDWHLHISDQYHEHADGGQGPGEV